jgi:diguanylate cyclase (GGDEF)-like protein/PAS domain S-box-containing protein
VSDNLKAEDVSSDHVGMASVVEMAAPDARAPMDADGHSASGEAVGVLRAAAAEAGGPQLALIGTAGIPRVIVWANEALLEILQVGAGDLVGHELSSLPGPGTADTCEWTVVVAAQARARAGRWSQAVVNRLDGSQLPVQLQVTAVDDAGWVVQLQPVTNAEQAAEQARNEAEHRFRAVAQCAPVGIVVSDAGVRLGFVNDQFAELLDRDASQLLGTRWLDRIHPRDLPSLQQALQTVLSGEPIEQAVRVLSRQDDPRWLQFRLAPVTTPRRAAGFIAVVEDITARRAHDTQLTYHANYDPLTGLTNRRQLMGTLSQLLTSSRSHDRRFAVLFADLDGFKQVNDTLGHHAGDQVLVEVARRLTGVAREHDLVARLAGDEFVIILDRTHDRASATAAAARYLGALREPVHLAGQPLTISASIGVALAADGDTPESLLAAADHNMYQAKAAGRGTYRHTTPAPAGPPQDRTTGPSRTQPDPHDDPPATHAGTPPPHPEAAGEPEQSSTHP